jgi:hypothetical protein
VIGQTNPGAQSLPYTQDFSGLAWTATTYPAGWQGWQTGTGAVSSYRTTAPTGDKAMTASGDASMNTGTVYNYNGKIGLLTSGSYDGAIVLAINSTGLSSIAVAYDAMTIRNPYDGVSNTRINEMTLQYRVGTSGSFVTLSGIEYQNNTTTQTSGTAPQNSQTKSIVLPAACNNSAVVQLRWVVKDFSGAGARPSFAVDNISVSGSSSLSGTYLIDEEFTATTSDANLTSTTAGFTSTSGWISNSSTVYNRRANCLRFTANGTLTTPIFSSGDLLSFWIQNVSGTPSGSLDIQTYNGSWSTLATITTISNIPQTYFYSINSGVTQIRFNFTRSGADVYFDDVMVRASGKCTGTSPLVERILVNSCNNTLEGRNELVVVKTGNTSIDVNNLFVTFPSVTSGGFSFGAGCTKTITTNASYTSALNTQAGCTVAVEPPGGIIPANSTLVIFTGATPEFTYDFSGLCGSSVYVIYCNNTETSGRFSNKPSAGTTRGFSLIDKATGCYDQVFYDNAITDVDGEQAMFDLSTRALSYGNFGCTQVLPIELINFSAVCNKTAVLISWATSSETNNDFFTIEKSTDLVKWVQIAIVKGAGNSDEVINYSYTDKNVADKNLYYRLKQKDYNGESKTFDPIVVVCDINQSENFVVYPNPAETQVNCTISSIEENNVILQITNYLGCVVYKKAYYLTDDFNNIILDVFRYNKGIYNITIYSNDGTLLQSRKIIIK